MHSDLYTPLLNRTVLLSLSTNQTIQGKLLSIDGYFNIALSGCVISHNCEQKKISTKKCMALLVVKGSGVNWIRLFDS